jgi:hypothetical protein
MSSSFYVSLASCRNLKEVALQRFPEAKSSHMTEAVAVALGFKTHAALRAALSGRHTLATQQPREDELLRRLDELGYRVQGKEHLLPELDRSYGPYRPCEIRTKRSSRWHVWRNLMVATVNAGLSDRVFGLSPDEDWWQNAQQSSCEEGGVFRFDLGTDRAVACVRNVGHDELSLAMALNPKRPDLVPTAFSTGLNEADAFAHGWLERRFGAWLQDAETLSCKRETQARLLALNLEPSGFSDHGRFFL